MSLLWFYRRGNRLQAPILKAGGSGVQGLLAAGRCGSALGQVWVCLPRVPLVPQPWYLWPGSWGNWKPLHMLQAPCNIWRPSFATCWPDSKHSRKHRRSGELRLANECPGRQAYVVFRKYICKKKAIFLLLVLCTTRCPWLPSPITWGELLTASGSGTAKPSLHVLFKYTEFQISFIFLLLPTPLIVHLADQIPFMVLQPN